MGVKALNGDIETEFLPLAAHVTARRAQIYELKKRRS
jgi:hypothetical protein